MEDQGPGGVLEKMLNPKAESRAHASCTQQVAAAARAASRPLKDT